MQLEKEIENEPNNSHDEQQCTRPHARMHAGARASTSSLIHLSITPSCVTCLSFNEKRAVMRCRLALMLLVVLALPC